MILGNLDQQQDERPVIGPRGELTYRDRTVYLSERNALLAGVLSTTSAPS